MGQLHLLNGLHTLPMHFFHSEFITLSWWCLRILGLHLIHLPSLKSLFSVSVLCGVEIELLMPGLSTRNVSLILRSSYPFKVLMVTLLSSSSLNK